MWVVDGVVEWGAAGWGTVAVGGWVGLVSAEGGAAVEWAAVEWAAVEWVAVVLAEWVEVAAVE